MQWHFLKKAKWCLKHLKLEYFQGLKNQKNQNNKAMLNIVHLVTICINLAKNLKIFHISLSDLNDTNNTDNKIFTPMKKGNGLKILTPKQMLQRLPIALAQIKVGNNSESLLNEIKQIVYSFHQSKEITKKVYHNIITSIKV